MTVGAVVTGPASEVAGPGGAERNVARLQRRVSGTGRAVSAMCPRLLSRRLGYAGLAATVALIPSFYLQLLSDELLGWLGIGFFLGTRGRGRDGRRADTYRRRCYRSARAARRPRGHRRRAGRGPASPTPLAGGLTRSNDARARLTSRLGRTPLWTSPSSSAPSVARASFRDRSQRRTGTRRPSRSPAGRRARD